MAEIQTMNHEPPPSTLPEHPPPTFDPSPTIPPPLPQNTIASGQLPSAQAPSSLPPPQQPSLPTVTPTSLPPPSATMPTTSRAQSQAQLPVPTQPPGRLPPGAPGRNYLNQHLAPYLRTGMTNVLDVRPATPLRYLGEYLIAQSLIYEGGMDDKGVIGAFTYDEHVTQIKKMRPEALGVDRHMTDEGHDEGEEGIKADTGGQEHGEDTQMAD